MKVTAQGLSPPGNGSLAAQMLRVVTAGQEVELVSRMLSGLLGKPLKALFLCHNKRG